MPRTPDAIRQQIMALVGEYYEATTQEQAFVPGQSPVPVSGRVLDAADLRMLVESGLEAWLTTGRFAAEFESRFARYFNLRHALLVNSGSSANLLAVSALTSRQLERPLRPGDEVITAATGFPTTVAPIVQNRMVPVFLDVTVPTYNVDVNQLEAALSKKTRAVFIAHTLGNPFDVGTVMEFVKQHDLYLIEDCCDAVGAEFRGRLVGTSGDFATVSFYPAHHITMGEGGCVLTDRPGLKRLIESFRDWGRDCWCDPGKENTCGKRFDWQLGQLPHGYDHKYTYSHLGYNLKLTDMQAAIGISQLDKLPRFIAARRENFNRLHAGLMDLEETFILPRPTPESTPSWFGFALAVREDAGFTRDRMVRYLESRKVATRLLFGGNMVKQPALEGVEFRVPAPLVNADFIMNRVFWVGVYPGLSAQHIDYLIEVLHEGVRTLRN